MDHLVSGGLDHCPIIIYLKNTSLGVEVKKHKLFRFEAMLEKENDCETAIQNCWKDGAEQGADIRIFDNLQQLRVGLLDCDMPLFGNVRR